MVVMLFEKCFTAGLVNKGHKREERKEFVDEMEAMNWVAEINYLNRVEECNYFISWFGFLEV